MVALDLVFFARGHAVIAEVIETKFAGGAVSDVAAIHLTPNVGRHLLLDAAHGDAEEVVKMSHPLGIAASKVVVDGDELGVARGEGVEIKRKRGDEGFAFAGSHFGDLTFVDRHAADELHIKVHHVPSELVIADDDLAAAEPAGGAFDGGERLGENRVERSAFVGGGSDTGAKLVGLGAELLVSESLVAQLKLVDARDDGAAFFEKLTIMTAGETFKEKREHEGGPERSPGHGLGK